MQGPDVTTAVPPPAPGATRHARHVLRGWMLPASVFLLYVWPFPHFDILRSPNELSRLYQARAIVEDGSLAVNGPVARLGPMGDLSEHAGRLYPNKAPGVSFAGAAVYAMLRPVLGPRPSDRALLFFLRLFICALPTVLLLRPLRRHAARLCGDPRAADAAILVYALGTLAFPYSILLFSHQPAAVCAAAALLFLERAREGGRGMRRSQIAAGALAGFAVLCEYTLAPVAAMLLAFGVATARGKIHAAARIAGGALPFAAALLAYQTVAFGGPFQTSYGHVQNAVFASWHAQGFMGVSVPRLSSLAGNLFSPARGLFAFSPALLLALPGMWFAWKRDRADAIYAAGVAAFYFFVAAAFLYEAWGWMLGPRHLAPLAPILVAPLACTVASLRARASTTPWRAALGVAAGFAVASILVNGFCTAVYPHIPDEFGAALAHLVWPLARTGHFPYDLAEALSGRVLRWTWLPWFAGLGAVAFVAASCALSGFSRRFVIGVAAATVVIHVAIQFVAVPRETDREVQTRESIMRTWEPGPGGVVPLFERRGRAP